SRLNTEVMVGRSIAVIELKVITKQKTLKREKGKEFGKKEKAKPKTEVITDRSIVVTELRVNKDITKLNTKEITDRFTVVTAQGSNKNEKPTKREKGEESSKRKYKT
ncbi:20073_t:CDS:2, partial [Racocetra persica]